jgi:hypothetical protein
MSPRVKTVRRWLCAGALPGLALLVSPGATSTVISHTTLERLTSTQSFNWSGYASTSGPFTSVSASWVQPAGTCTSKPTYSSFWVGIDGDGSGSVEQTGSEVDCAGGTPKYYAWYEMYPALPVNFSNVVKPGDHFSASVTTHGTVFTLVIKDTSEHWSHTLNKSSTIAVDASAEIIAEAPSDGGTTLPLTDFGTVRFTAAEANGKSIAKQSPDQITMVTEGGKVMAKPSALSGDDFSVVWHHS